MRPVFLLCFLLIVAVLQAQPVVFINAGSRAGYGQQQELTIDADGRSRFYLREVNGPVRDSAVFTLSRQQLDSFFSKAVQNGFFNLQKNYDGGAADGAGIYISLRNAGRTHSVQLLNTDVPAVNELIAWLNRLLAPHRVRIYYGQNLK